MDTLAVAVVGTKAARVLPAGEARLIAQAVKCPEASKQVIADALPAVMEKYGVGSDKLPEIALLSGLGGWVGGIALALQQIEKLAQERLEAEERRKAPTPPPAAAPAVPIGS